MEGIEPPLPSENQILSLARLPIPPHRLIDDQWVMFGHPYYLSWADPHHAYHDT